MYSFIALNMIAFKVLYIYLIINIIINTFINDNMLLPMVYSLLNTRKNKNLCIIYFGIKLYIVIDYIQLYWLY